MTDKEKLEKAVKLADAMYHAAQYMTTDASKLHKAMEDYHQFIINDYCKEESASEDLEQASKEWLRPQLDKSYADYGEIKMMELTHFDGYAMLDAVEFGAQWQRERMTKDAISGFVVEMLNIDGGVAHKYIETDFLPAKEYEKGQEVKVIIIKD